VAVEEQPLHRALGLTDDELERIVRTLGREPNRNELAMYGAMWSEHCSYKSSKIHLRTLPTEGSAVLVGPGRTPGRSTSATASRWSRWSRTHPSAIEARAAGVGGRAHHLHGRSPGGAAGPADVRPPHRRNRWLLGGVVRSAGTAFLSPDGGESLRRTIPRTPASTSCASGRSDEG
jgi:phosphoribosylformylglycinamidine synthase